MNGMFSTIAAVTTASIFGFFFVGDVAVDYANNEGPVIVINDIRLLEDGSVFYDRTTPENKWIIWSGQILSKDERKLICWGNGTAPYTQSENPLWSKDIAWMISPNCLGKIEKGQKWVFNWVDVDGIFQSVRYPEKGYGVIE